MTSDSSRNLHISKFGIAVSIAMLAALVAISLLRAGDERRFVQLLEGAEPLWLILAVVFQLGTYTCAGAIWGRVARSTGHRLRIPRLARIAIEKLSVDQFVPTGGMAGNFVVVSSMRRMGLPFTLATEALLIEIISYYFAFAAVAAVAVVVLHTRHDVTPVLKVLLTVFGLVVGIVPLAIAWVLKHRSWKPGVRLARIGIVQRILETLGRVAPQRVWNRDLLATATVLQMGVFILDAATLWAMLHAIGAPVHPLTAFVALVIAAIAGALSFLPGGLGTYEAGCTATLALLGVPVEAALTGTLLLRGLTLWLPLLPGLFLAHRDFARAAPEANGALSSTVTPGAGLPALLEQLATQRAGLSTAEAAARLAASGENVLELRRARTALGEFARSLESPLALILLAASVASAFLGQTADAVIIAAMVLLSSGINFLQSSRSAKAVEGLQARVTPTATVLRDGEWVTAPRRDVVVGDVIQLSAGDLIPADARLLESTDLHVQQAALTGESLPAEKMAAEQPIARTGPDARELLFVGTSVISGTAKAVVYATGSKTAFGDVAARLAARPEETEFERGMRHFGTLILQTISFLVLFILVVSLAMGRDPFQSLLFAVALAVGLTPEYLPMITTVTLAQGARRMAKQKVIVKHLAAIQNLGSIDILCSDKTGTLTSGEMTLNTSLDPRGSPSERPLLLGRLNSRFETGVKSALDAAILENAAAPAGGYRKMAEIPFDFERRRLSVLLERDQEIRRSSSRRGRRSNRATAKRRHRGQDSERRQRDGDADTLPAGRYRRGAHDDRRRT